MRMWGTAHRAGVHPNTSMLFHLPFTPCFYKTAFSTTQALEEEEEMLQWKLNSCGFSPPTYAVSSPPSSCKTPQPSITLLLYPNNTTYLFYLFFPQPFYYVCIKDTDKFTWWTSYIFLHLMSTVCSFATLKFFRIGRRVVICRADNI